MEQQAREISEEKVTGHVAVHIHEIFRNLLDYLIKPVIEHTAACPQVVWRAQGPDQPSKRRGQAVKGPAGAPNRY